MKDNFRRFLIGYTFTFLSILIVVAGVNFHVDPANIFSNNDYENLIAKMLAEGRNVANISNCDERLIQKLYIQKLTISPKIIILGSSRAMGISSRFFPGKIFFNSSVSGATIQDYLAIYGIFLERGLIPKTVVIGAEPWLLNKNNGQERWEVLKGSYEAMIGKLHMENHPGQFFWPSYSLKLEKISQLLNIKYFIRSVKLLKRDRHIYASEDLEGEVPIKHADGSLSYAKAFREMQPTQVREKAVKYAQEIPVYSLGAFKKLDEQLKEMLEKFIDLLNREGIEVILFLAPYHPVTYEILMNQEGYRGILREAEAYFRDLAKRKGLKVIGSYDPRGLGGLEDFYDGMHPKENCIKNILQQLRQG